MQRQSMNMNIVEYNGKTQLKHHITRNILMMGRGIERVQNDETLQ